ncbi:MAG: GGDEF domain-containing protein, partial [Actinobacteria bacterium]|nr:GGDEF domain-containing protein [Actinomycetota bacterium]
PAPAQVDELAELERAYRELAADLEVRKADLEKERRRLRDTNARFGEALATALDPDQLRRVILESAVEATHAVGGVLIGDDGRKIEAGELEDGTEQLEFELVAGRRSFGRLVLAGTDFDPDDRMTAAVLVGQAVVALDNARLHRIVEQQAIVDGLTGLANRRHAEELLTRELARSARFGGPVGLILADVDDFKAINDEYGHPIGDAVLREVAGALLGTIREVDVAARWGGEEFAVVLPGTDLEGAARAAERIRDALARRDMFAPDGGRLHVTASFGVVCASQGTTSEELVAVADAALYRAKRGGKDRVDVGATSLPRL